MMTIFFALVLIALAGGIGYEAFVAYKHNIKTATKAVDKVEADATADADKVKAAVTAVVADVSKL